MKNNSGFKKDIAFAVRHAPLHIQAFYGRLIEYLCQELGEDIDIIGDGDYENIADLDGMYKIVMFCTRGAATHLSDNCATTRSFLVDHGPIHTNRAPHGHVDFEVFSSEYLRKRLSQEGLGAEVKSWSGGYFLTDHLLSSPIRKGECLVYLIHNTGWLANSMSRIPFTDDQTIGYLDGLSKIFRVVHVVSHINGGINFVTRYRQFIPGNVLSVSHGNQYMNLIASVEVVFLEYSSALATTLWNPEVKIFIRNPKFPLGPITLHARYLHELMERVGYPIIEDSLETVDEMLRNDPKHLFRVAAKSEIYDINIDDPYEFILRCVRDAVRIVG